MLKNCQIYKEPIKICQSCLKFCQSGEILPNLVTLAAILMRTSTARCE